MNVFTIDAIIIFVQLLYDKKSSQIVNSKRINENRKKKSFSWKKRKKKKKNKIRDVGFLHVITLADGHCESFWSFSQ